MSNTVVIHIFVWKDMKYFVRLGTQDGQTISPPSKVWEETTQSEEELLAERYTDISVQAQLRFVVHERKRL